MTLVWLVPLISYAQMQVGGLRKPRPDQVTDLREPVANTLHCVGNFCKELAAETTDALFGRRLAEERHQKIIKMVNEAYNRPLQYDDKGNVIDGKACNYLKTPNAGQAGTSAVPQAILTGMVFSMLRSLCGRGGESSDFAKLKDEQLFKNNTMRGILMSPPSAYNPLDMLDRGHYGDGLRTYLLEQEIADAKKILSKPKASEKTKDQARATIEKVTMQRDQQVAKLHKFSYSSRTYAIMTALIMQEAGANILEAKDQSKEPKDDLGLRTDEAGMVQASPNSQDTLSFLTKQMEEGKSESEKLLEVKARKEAYRELLQSYLKKLEGVVKNSKNKNEQRDRLDQTCMTTIFVGEDGSQNGKVKANVSDIINRVQDVIRGQLKRVDRIENIDTLTNQEFLELNKACPAFAVEYGSLLLRINSSANGPINRREVNPDPACERLYESVANQANPNYCRSLEEYPPDGSLYEKSNISFLTQDEILRRKLNEKKAYEKKIAAEKAANAPKNPARKAGPSR